jgi:branched-chain amino acid transport system permease protein
MVTEAITGLAAGAAYALVAVGVVLIYKGTRTLSIAQGEIGAFGFFFGLRWHERGVPFLPGRPHPSLFMMLVIAVVIGGLLGLVIERLIMRPLVRRPPLDALTATLGIALLLALLELKIFGQATQNAPSPVGSWSVEILGATLTAPRIVALVLAAAVAGAVYLFFTRTKFGLAVLATTGDPTVARLVGVKVNRVYVFAWVAGGMLSGLAAALLGPAFGGLTPFDMTTFALKALAGAVIGGLDSVWGAIVGSLVVGVLEQVVKGQVGTTAGAA